MATKKSKKDPLKSKAEWTITEFQMWLHGAYSLQGEDWVPNEDQWNMIVDIIYKLKDRAIKPARPLTAAAPYAATPHQHMMVGNEPQADFGGPMPVAGGALANVDIPEEASLSLSELKRRREAGGAANGNVLAGGGAPGEKTVKTGTFE